MATKGTVTVRTNIYQNGEEMSPNLGDIDLLDDYRPSVAVGHEIAASASDVSIPVAGAGTTGYLILKLVDTTQTGKITVKVNGDSTAFNLDPFVILSENITALTASNSDSSNAVKVEWASVVS